MSSGTSKFSGERLQHMTQNCTINNTAQAIAENPHSMEEEWASRDPGKMQCTRIGASASSLTYRSVEMALFMRDMPKTVSSASMATGSSSLQATFVETLAAEGYATR